MGRELLPRPRVRVGVRGLLLLLGLLFMAPGLGARVVEVRGRLTNSAELKALYPAVNIRSLGYLRPASGVDPATGAFIGELDCEVIRNEHGQWMDIAIEAFPYAGQRRPTMVIRMPFASSINLGAFEWRAGKYRWKHGALVMDTAVPRDTVITDGLRGTSIVLRPVNPLPKDSMTIEFEWPSSGAPHVAGYAMSMKDCCTVLIDFTFAVRTDVDVYGDSWAQRATPFKLPGLEAGRYRLRQVAAQGEHVRDIDFLLSRELFFTVGERTEP